MTPYLLLCHLLSSLMFLMSDILTKTGFVKFTYYLTLILIIAMIYWYDRLIDMIDYFIDFFKSTPNGIENVM